MQSNLITLKDLKEALESDEHLDEFHVLLFGEEDGEGGEGGEPAEEPAEEEAAGDDDGEALTAEDVKGMTKKELLELIDEHKLGVDPAKVKNLIDLRNAVIKEAFGEEEEVEEEEVEEEGVVDVGDTVEWTVAGKKQKGEVQAVDDKAGKLKVKKSGKDGKVVLVQADKVTVVTKKE